MAHSLTDTKIKTAKKSDKPYKLTDAKGLYVDVRPTGAKLWRYRYRIDGKENIYSFGEYGQARSSETAEQAQQRRAGGVFTLEEARQERVRARGLVKQGIHPKTQRDARVASDRADASNTFKAVAAEHIERNKGQWTPKYAALVAGTLQRYAYPIFGAIPIRQVGASQIRLAMEALEDKGLAVTAINLRQYCSAIFSHAMRTERADADPTTALRGHVKRPPVKHKTPLTKAGVKDLRSKIKLAGYRPTQIALELLLFTFVRPVEMRQAEWSEFDLEAGVWTIPAEKMKKREKHLVPLPEQARALLLELKSITGGSRWLFPNIRTPKTFMCDTTLNKALRGLGFAGKFSAHGFRATASTFLHELDFDSDLIEFQLAHQDRDETRASYNQAMYWDQRKAMMQQYADLVDAWSRDGNVVPIGRAA